MEEISLLTARHRWYLLQTRPHQERSVSEALQHLGVDAIFLQLSGEKNADALMDCDEPLFPRYLLVRLDLGVMAASVRRIHGVTRLLKMNNEFVPVHDSLVTALCQPSQHGKGMTATGWVALCASAGYAEREPENLPCAATRALQFVELVCQTQRKSMFASPLRRVA
jgi:transcription antitermination factor NusG